MIKIIAIDPGRTTGYCYAIMHDDKTYTDEKKLEYWPFQVNDEVEDLWNRLKRFNPHCIIIEDFEFRRGKYAGSGGGGLDLFPCQLIGIARLYATLAGRRIDIQKASQGKQYYTNQVLKDKGLFKKGAAYEHAMDASRHLLQWATFGRGYEWVGNSRNFAKLIEAEDWPDNEVF